MSEHELAEEIRRLREELIIMATANDQALADLTAAVAQLTTDVAALIAAIPTGTSDDISAGVEDAVSSLTSLDSQVTAVTAGLTPTADPETADAPVNKPPFPPVPGSLKPSAVPSAPPAPS